MNIIVWMQPQSNLFLCPGFCKEDWSVLVCQRQPIRVPGNLCVQLAWMDRPLSWFGLTKRGTSVCSRTAGKLSLRSSDAADPASSSEGLQRSSRLQNTLVWNKRRNQNSELDFLNVLNWTFETQCTGQFVQLLFAAVSLFFPSGLSKWRFLDLTFPSGQIYTQRRGSGGSFRQSRCKLDIKNVVNTEFKTISSEALVTQMDLMKLLQHPLEVQTLYTQPLECFDHVFKSDNQNDLPFCFT